MVVARLGGGDEARQLVERFAFDPHREQDRAELKIGHDPAQHRRIKRTRVVAREVACGLRAAADLPDIAGQCSVVHIALSNQNRGI